MRRNKIPCPVMLILKLRLIHWGKSYKVNNRGRYSHVLESMQQGTATKREDMLYRVLLCSRPFAQLEAISASSSHLDHRRNAR